MKKITLIIATFIFSIGAYAQGDPNCSMEVLEGGNNAWGQLHQFIFASDFKVAENESFSLSSLQFNAMATPEVPINGVTLYFYEDTGAGPGAELGTQDISEFNITPIGLYGGIDHFTVSLELNNPFQFEGNISTSTTYWVGVIIDFNESDMSFIEVTEEFDTDNATYFYDNQSQTWIDGANPMWPLGGFEHAMISLYGDCSVLGIEDFTLNSFTHFIQNEQLVIESLSQIQEVSIYNSLGQQVITENINSSLGQVNLSSLNAGIYLSRINMDGNIKSFKFSVK